jgi:hypothetical protein
VYNPFHLPRQDNALSDILQISGTLRGTGCHGIMVDA